jgi:hypothetical protein
MKSTELKKDIILWKDLQKLYNKQQKDAVKNWIDEICNEVSDWKKTIKTEIEEMKNGNSRSIENLLGNADGEHDEVKADSSSGRKRRSGV